MDDLLLRSVTVVTTGVVVALITRPILVRLPEPTGSPEKVAYRDLATPRFVVACSVGAVVAQVLALAVLPLRVQPSWTVLATCGVLLAAIDARTTWLPLRLTRAGWLSAGLAVAVSAVLGATVADVVRTMVGAAIAGFLYLVIWAVTKGGFGFGDVRFAPLLGAAAASESWTLLLWGLTLGTVVGAVHGAARLLRRKEGPFPYAPSMLVGTYLAAIALHLLVLDGGGP